LKVKEGVVIRKISILKEQGISKQAVERFYRLWLSICNYSLFTPIPTISHENWLEEEPSFSGYATHLGFEGVRNINL